MKESKSILRQEIVSKCSNLDPNVREYGERQIAINSQPLLLDVNSIAVYHACKWELDLSQTIEDCFNLGKKIYHPVAYTDSKQMRFEECHQCRQMIFYCKEHQLINEIKWYNLDLVFVPLVAVDNDGYRLGKGGGYYDATFAKIATLDKRPVLCGVGFAQQIVDKLPRDDWDVKLDYFVSELGLIKF